MIMNISNLKKNRFKVITAEDMALKTGGDFDESYSGALKNSDLVVHLLDQFYIASIAVDDRAICSTSHGSR